MPFKRWEIVFGVDVTGPFLCARAVLPAMIEQGGGSMGDRYRGYAYVGRRGGASGLEHPGYDGGVLPLPGAPGRRGATGTVATDDEYIAWHGLGGSATP